MPKKISPKAVGVFVMVMTAVLVAFDIYLAMDGLDGNTYTENIRVWAASHWWIGWLITFAFGVLSFHFFAKIIIPGLRGGKSKPRLVAGGALMVALSVAGMVFCYLIGFY